MTTLNDINVVDNATVVLAQHINELQGNALRSEYSNVETLSGTRTLLDADMPIQRLNCNGLSRIVKAPTPNAVENHIYMIINASSAGEIIQLKSNDETILHATIEEGDAAFIIPDGDGGYFPFASTPAPTVQILNNYLTGLKVSNNASDATNDIDIAAGQAADSTNSVMMTLSACTKRLDAGWVAGTNQGMRNSAAAITDTTYHIYEVSKALGASVDIYAHTSATISTVLTALQAETGGADYIYARCIFSIVRTGGAIRQFIHDGDDVRWLVPVQDLNTTNPGTSAVTRTLSVPTGRRFKANLSVLGYGLDAAGNPQSVYISDLSVTDSAGSTTVFSLSVYTGLAGATQMGGLVDVYTNTSAQVRSRVQVSTANTGLLINTNGYTDRRGKDG